MEGKHNRASCSAMPLRVSSQPKMCFPRILKNLFFTDGKPLEETVEDLKKNPQKVLPKMKFVEFDGKTWSRSNRRLACYKRAGISELEEGVHFEMYPPDDHFFGGLDNRIFFARKEDFDTRTYCSLRAVPFSRRVCTTLLGSTWCIFQSDLHVLQKGVPNPFRAAGT